MTKYNILLAPGDGIGPEIVEEAVNVLEAAATKHDCAFHFDSEAVGGVAIELYGTALRKETLDKAKASDAILFGAVGDPKYDQPDTKVRPEQAILGLRKELGLFANLRPMRVNPHLLDASPIKPQIVDGADIMIIRELTGGIYFGEPRRRWIEDGERWAVDTMSYNDTEIRRVVKLAFETARKRNKHVTSVDKANVLDTSRLWREISTDVAAQYPDVAFEHMLVDACAMHLIKNPKRFDVIVTENMFGDILTDEASMVAGSLGVMPSACLSDVASSESVFGLYGPIHGSAPDIKGQGRANPIGTILSAAMMCRHSLGRDDAARAIESAIDRTLADGYRTADIAQEGTTLVNTAEMGEEIAKRV